MAYLRLALKPGIDKQNTEYGAEGGWIDSDYVRFRYGLPEKMGGWTMFAGQETYLLGQCSEVFTWSDLAGSPYAAVGTNRKLYVLLVGHGRTLPLFEPRQVLGTSRLPRATAQQLLL